MSITISDDVVHVLVNCSVDSDIYEEVASIAAEQLELFKKQHGYLGGAVMKSKESNTIVTYLQWRCKEDHDACLQSSDWHSDENAKTFAQWMQAGKVKIKPEVYDLIATLE